MVGGYPSAAHQHTVGIEPDGDHVGARTHGAVERKTVRPADQVVRTGAATERVGAVVAAFQNWRRGRQRCVSVDRDGLQFSTGTVHHASGRQSLDAGRQGRCHGIGGARVPTAAQSRLRLDVDPALRNIVGVERVPNQLSGALLQANDIAGDHAASGCVQAHAHHRGLLAGDRIRVAHTTVVQGAERDEGGCQWVGGQGAHVQLVGCAVDGHIARQIDTLHHDFVGCGAVGKRTGQRNFQRPSAVRGVDLQTGHGGVRRAVDVHGSALLVAVGHAVDQYGQTVMATFVKGARQCGGCAGGLQKIDGGTGRGLLVHHDHGGRARCTPLARFVLLNGTHMVHAGGQSDASEAVCARGVIRGHYREQLGVVQAAIVVAVVVQTHGCARVGKTCEGQIRAGGGDAILIRSPCIAYGRQDRACQGGRRIAVHTDRVSQRHGAHVARFIGCLGSEDPATVEKRSTCVSECPLRVKTHFGQTQRLAIFKNFDKPRARLSGAAQGETCAAHGQAV